MKLSERCQKVGKVARQMMDQYGLQDWEFKFNTNKRRGGVCKYRHSTGQGTIELSVHMVNLNPWEEIKDTILHEIAHALVGIEHGHNEVWKNKARQIGCSSSRCGDFAMPIGDWRAKCPGCGHLYHRHRQPRRGSLYNCTRCNCKQPFGFAKTFG